MHLYDQFETALRLLDGRLALAAAPSYRLVVCGGTALVATGLLQRATRDIDIVALAERLSWRRFGEHLAIGFLSRFDQIHFKLHAAVDQFGSYHAADLQALQPTDEELIEAATWSRSHVPSPGYRESLRAFLGEFGDGHLVDRV